MRNPFRTEAEAFSFVLVCVVLFALVAVAVGLALYVKSEPKESEPAVWERGGGDGRRRLLVVANETVAGRALREEVVRRAQGETDVLVVCPALNTQLRHWASDEDRAREVAQARLDESLAALADEGVQARGAVGDADPVQAIDDALRTFGADEIVVSTHPPGRSNWLEKGVIARSQERYGCPLTHVVVDLEAERGGTAAANDAASGHS